MIGDSGAGKSCIIERVINDKYFESYNTTIGVDFRVKTVKHNGMTIKVQIWDTAGQERFRTITTAYYRGANAIILCFDLTDYESFSDLDSWLQETKKFADPETPIILVGNKCDSRNRIVEKDRIDAYAKSRNLDFIEASAKTGTNITDVFNSVIEKIYQKQLANPPVKDIQNIVMLGNYLLPDKKNNNKKCCDI